MHRRILYATDERSTRHALEQKDVSIVTHLEETPKKDKLRHTESGLTPVIARIAAKNRTAFGIDVLHLKQSTRKEKARILTRMRQNLYLARKAAMPLAHRGNKEEVRYLLLSLGASTKQAAEARTQSF